MLEIGKVILGRHDTHNGRLREDPISDRLDELTGRYLSTIGR
jgi:hypothetical protein